MPQESQLAHRNLRNLNLPYVSNTSPIDTEPKFMSNSINVLTSINGYAERRPGFADTVEVNPSSFFNLQRLFTWDRTDGSFYVMACDVDGAGNSLVYKMQVGVDLSFVLIYTAPTADVFDFVVSNNTVYFSNGNVAKKWDPVNGVSNWGIAIGSINSNSGAFVGSGTSTAGSFSHPWASPANFQGPPDSVFSTCTFTTPAHSASGTDLLNGLSFAFSPSIPNTATVVGIQVSLAGMVVSSAANYRVSVALQLSGAPIGTPKFPVIGSSYTTAVMGTTSDLWGTTNLTGASVNSSTFGVQVSVSTTNGTGVSGTTTASMDAAQITVFYVGGPPIALVAGTLNAVNGGYTYEYCYGNSNTGHISSPTPISASTGNFASQNVHVTVVASTDPQVNQIRVFRNTDGGAGTYYELPTSPYPNVNAVITDSAPDTSLNVLSIAPTPTFNDPPVFPTSGPPGTSGTLQGMVYFAGRIWGFVGNKVWFSGLEEIVQGVPEESFPSGLAGNFYAFDEPVNALAVAGGASSQILIVFCGGRIYGIAGNTLDTFWRYNISQRRGCRNKTTVSMLGGMVAWFDSSNQIWATDGTNLNELAIDIRPDLVGLNPANCDMTFHVSGRFHWAVFSTGARIFVYDMDTNQWMPPWTFVATYVYSGEISPGNYVLMASTSTTALQMDIDQFNDFGATYQVVMTTSLMSVVPDYGKRFSYMAMGIYDEPSRTGVPWYFQVTNNAQSIQDFLYVIDDDPRNATFTSLAANLITPATAFNRNQGTFVTQNIYSTITPASRWVAVQVVLPSVDRVDNIYELWMNYKPLGGR